MAVRYLFKPPTHEEPMRTKIRPMWLYRLTHANSIFRDGPGAFRSVRNPYDAPFTGTEGVDYFIGGYEYFVSEELAGELEAAGFTVLTVTDDLPDPDPTPDPDPVLTGYGAGLYGDGYYGGIGGPVTTGYGSGLYGSGNYGG